MRRWRDTARRSRTSVLRPESDLALPLRFTINRPPNWCRLQSASTASVSGPSNPTIITAPTSSSRESPAEAVATGVGGGEVLAVGCPPHATITASRKKAAIRVVI